jgi:2OG-Fe(II) oxygenase superfamily
MNGSSGPSKLMMFRRGLQVPKTVMNDAASGQESGVLQYGQWWEYKYPFRHLRATDILPAKSYDAISAAFSEILNATQCTREGQPRFRQSTANYDVEMLALNKSLAPRFQPFFTQRWLKSLSGLLDIPFTAKIDGALHSAPKGSRTGWIHTDCCSGWFDADTEATSDGIIFPDRSRCDYFEGRAHVADAKPVEYIRAATFIFYLCNPSWKSGQGGETGLYSSAKESSNARFDLIPPRDNTLLLFECSPHSYHRFITNPGCRRNSIILWLHSTPKFASSRWGADAIKRRGGK